MMSTKSFPKKLRLFRIVRNLLRYGIFKVSVYFKRNNNLMIFSGGGTFSGNSKYLFLYILKNEKRFQPIWVAKKKEELNAIKKMGLPVVKGWSLEGIKTQLSAKYCFHNNYRTNFNWYLTKGIIDYNLWHGVGLKRIGFNNIVGPSKHRFDKSILSKILYPEHYIKPNYLISTSKFASTNFFSSAFRLPEDQILNFGYSRCDFLLASIEERKNYYDLSDKEKETRSFLEQFTRVIIYMPTWRATKAPFMEEVGFNFEELNDLCAKSDTLFVFKLHPYTKHKKKNKSFKNILFINNNIDPYTYLDLTDILITDYSSIYYEMLLMKNKKIILFPFDQKRYLEKDQSFTLDFEEHIGGSIVYSYKELIVLIKNDSKIKEQPSFLIDKFWGNYRGDANQNILNYIIKNEES